MNGIGVSPGISIGRAFVIQKDAAVVTGILLPDETAISNEIERFDSAVAISVREIEAIRTNLLTDKDMDALEILETHIEFLTDPEIRAGVVQKIQEARRNVNDALIEVIGDTVRLFKEMDDVYLGARAADVQDIGDRIRRNLNTPFQTGLQKFEPDTILIAEDISPSDTLAMDIKNISGFATRAGGATSHAAIIAKSRGIPAVAGCGNELEKVQTGDLIILDGSAGIVIINPGPDNIDAYRGKKEAFGKNAILLRQLKDLPAMTLDGKRIRLTANIGGAGDIEEMFNNGGDGVGLFRTELLFMGRNSFPTEEEQFDFYKKAALRSRDKPIIIRTIDIGGDKQLPYFGLAAEQNPFLGYRAIRICLDRKDLFITQLKAILRASVFGPLKIMFPMISSVQEIRTTKMILAEAKNELLAKHTDFDEKIETGIMIEIPSAAVTADILSKEVDFFSIGTNDLCQYTLAVDRMNEKIKDLYDPFNPGVLRLISNTIEQAHKNNIHAGMCGEMASDPMATLLLLGMGLDEFSMSAPSIPAIKNIINSNTLSAAREIYHTVMAMDNSQNIKAYLREINQ